MSLLDSELAEGRQWLRLGDAYEVTKKPRGLDMASLPAVPFVSMDAIPQGGAYSPGYTMRPPGEIRSGTYFERGDALIAKITPSFENGKQALATGLPTPFGIATTEVIPLRPRKERQDRRLLFFYLLHPDVRHHVAERMEGTTGRQRIPADVLLSLPFPKFDPEEQTTVSDTLEMIQQLMAVETQSIETTQALKRAAMRSLFTRGLRGEAQKETEIGPVPENWEPATVASVATVKGGKRMSKGVSLTSENTGQPYIRVTDFTGHGVDTDNIRYVPRGYESAISRYIISTDDVYISIAGTIGLVGQIPKVLDGANLTENAARISLTSGKVIPRFLMYALASGACQTQIVQSTATNAQPKLALVRIEQIKLPVPPTLDDQHEIVAVLEGIDRKADLHMRKRAVLEELFKTLLHKLMTGEIELEELNLAVLAERADDVGNKVGRIGAGNRIAEPDGTHP